MAVRIVALFCLVTLCMWVISCERLPEGPKTPLALLLKMETFKSFDHIPAEFGNLVGVTSNSSSPGWAQLWFEKPDKTIIVVEVNFNKGALGEGFMTIPRR